ncbi:MAG: mannose-1-phosphate guanylyltransferase, partial [candidate division Zixibacteria bacterium]|nr:mannose-1-phosphate guanylyltransferase [candidate division Zixibacteria bacterium]
SGGKGERFWPLSRSDHPKQLLKIHTDRPMLEETFQRIREFIPLDRTLIITGKEFRDVTLAAVKTLKPDNLILEPEGKNTCLAVGLTAAYLKKKDPEAVMVVLPSDHLIEPKESLVQVLEIGCSIAKQGDYLITLGIPPTRPETGYGYIQLGEQFSTQAGINVYRIKKFKEKPSRTVAQQYYLDREHLWNSGMFIWTASAILSAIQKHVPAMHRELERFFPHIGTKQEAEELKKLYSVAENISIDFAVLEKADNVLTIRTELHWDDVGSWLALERIKSKDRDHNVSLGKTVSLDSYESTIVNDGDGIIVTFGVSDLVIVNTDKIVFVAHKTRVSDLKELLQKLGSDSELSRYL